MTVYETDVPGVDQTLALQAGLPTVASVAVGYVLVRSVLGTVPMRYSGPVERLVTPGATA